MAAFIEGYATRHTVVTLEGDPIPTEWPPALKWTFILTCFAIVIFYFVIYPRMVAKKHNFTGKVVESPQFKEKKEVEFNRIKKVGELFSDTFSSYARVFGLFAKMSLITLPIIGILVWRIFEIFPVYQYQIFDQFNDWGRMQKIWANVEVVFQWNQYFDWELFAINVFLFLSLIHI